MPADLPRQSDGQGQDINGSRDKAHVHLLPCRTVQVEIGKCLFHAEPAAVQTAALLPGNGQTSGGPLPHFVAELSLT